MRRLSSLHIGVNFLFRTNINWGSCQYINTIISPSEYTYLYHDNLTLASKRGINEVMYPVVKIKVK